MLGDSYYREALEQNIHKVLKKSEVDRFDQDIAELHEELMKKAINKEDYKILVNQIEYLKSQKDKMQADRAHNQNTMKRLVKVRSFLDDQTGELEEYDDQLVRNLVDRITVFDNRLDVDFRNGTKISICITNE